MRYTTKILPSLKGNVGIVSLNNPKSLHALTLDMIYCLQDVFNEWCGTTSNVKAIVIKSNKPQPEEEEEESTGDDSNKKTKKKRRPLAFCAGGDVKSVYQHGMDIKNQVTRSNITTDIESDFFYQEYLVNHKIATCGSNPPIISLWDGIVMGGGVGISIHGKYRVATENTIFAMPETTIGLFPDVGSMYWMNQLLKHPKQNTTTSKSSPMANYLALVGKRITASDLLYTGLATHYIPSQQLESFEFDLIDACSNSNSKDGDGSSNTSDVAKVLMSYHEFLDTSNCFLKDHSNLINTTFDEVDVENIIRNLEKSGDNDETARKFTTETLETLHKVSPTSLKLTLEGLQRGASWKTINDDLTMEYNMVSNCTNPYCMAKDLARCHSHDFYEGVRALLVDKDMYPKWYPSKLEDVTKEYINEFFTLPSTYKTKEWKVDDGTSTTSKL